MRLVAAFVVCVPAWAFAQSPADPSPPPEAPPPGPYAPGPAQPGQGPYTPGPQGPYGQPGQGPYGQPGQGPYAPAQPGQGPYAPAQPGQGPYAPAQPGQGPYAPAPYGQPTPYAQPYAPYPPPPPPRRSFKTGVTFEANLGVGWLVLDDGNQSDASDAGMGGLCLGVGGWMNERLALTGRLSGVTLQRDSASLSHIFLGPSAQYWLSEQFWVGGGIGLSILSLSARGSASSEPESITGLGLDLRAGVTFNTGSKNTFNASLELNPGFYREGHQSVTITGVAIMVGYQLL